MSLSYFIREHNLDLLLVQETIGASRDLCNFLERSLKGFSFTELDSFGNSRGLISRWFGSVVVTKFFVVTSRLLLKFLTKVLSKSFKVVNAYGPYVDYHDYWDKNFNSNSI